MLKRYNIINNNSVDDYNNIFKHLLLSKNSEIAKKILINHKDVFLKKIKGIYSDTKTDSAIMLVTMLDEKNNKQAIEIIKKCAKNHKIFYIKDLCRNVLKR